MVKSFGWSGVTISNDAQFKKFDDLDSLSDDMFVACTDCVTWIYKPEVPKQRRLLEEINFLGGKLTVSK